MAKKPAAKKNTAKSAKPSAKPATSDDAGVRELSAEELDSVTGGQWGKNVKVSFKENITFQK